MALPLWQDEGLPPIGSGRLRKQRVGRNIADMSSDALSSALGDVDERSREARSRLITLKREVAAHRMRAGRAAALERKQQEALAVRESLAELTGRQAMRALLKVHAMDDTDLQEISETLNERLLEDHHEDASNRSRMWVNLWREMDVEKNGRVDWPTFSAMLRSKLRLHRRTCAWGVVETVVQSLWRALDDDGQGEPKGYLVLREFLHFMRLGVGEQDAAAAADERQGWRGKLGEERRQAAKTLREERRRQREASELMAQQTEWRAEMRHIRRATEAELRQLSTALHERLSAGEGWFGLFKVRPMLLMASDRLCIDCEDLRSPLVLPHDHPMMTPSWPL